MSDIKLQQVELTLRNKTIHNCDLENVCDALEIQIEIISIRNDGNTRVEHYGKTYEEKYYLGLIKNHYFINDITTITSYCLEHYDEVKEIKSCNTIYKKKDAHFKRDNSGNKFIKAFQLFKILINNIDKLISPMTLTEDVMRTHFYDKIDDYNTLEYTKQSYRLEKYEPKIKEFYK